MISDKSTHCKKIRGSLTFDLIISANHCGSSMHHQRNLSPQPIFSSLPNHLLIHHTYIGQRDQRHSVTMVLAASMCNLFVTTKKKIRTYKVNPIVYLLSFSRMRLRIKIIHKDSYFLHFVVRFELWWLKKSYLLKMFYFQIGKKRNVTLLKCLVVMWRRGSVL